MMRLVAFVISAAVLAGCSGSSRTGNFPFGGATMAPRPGTPADRLDGRGTPKTAPQEAKKPDSHTLFEE
jgi:hypothetical protein